jgi:hypothetical protein
VYPRATELAESSGAKVIVAHAGEMVGTDGAGVFVDSVETVRRRSNALSTACSERGWTSNSRC